MADVLAVADACGARTFDLVGYSYGCNIGRFLAARTDRVKRFVLIGIGFGGGAEGPFRARMDAMLAPYAAVLADPPDPDALSPKARAQWDAVETRRLLTWFAALRDWPGVEPHELRCPTLWLVGSRNEVGALDNLEAHRPRLAEYEIQAEILPDLDHTAEMSARDVVLPHLLRFLA